jgi:uncharacterized membrane protein
MYFSTFDPMKEKNHKTRHLIPNFIVRFIFSGVIAVFGVLHIMNGEMMAEMIPSYLPGGVIWVYITGACLIAGGIAIAINKMAKLAGYLLALLLMTFVITVHFPGGQASIGQVMKDTALAMASIFIANHSN